MGITERLTITPAAILAIVREMDEVTSRHVREIHIAPENGTTYLVTFDAGYGTYSFHVNRNSGKTWQAGLGVGAALCDHTERALDGRCAYCSRTDDGYEQPSDEELDERYPGEREAKDAVARGVWEEA